MERWWEEKRDTQLQWSPYMDPSSTQHNLMSPQSPLLAQQLVICRQTMCGFEAEPRCCRRGLALKCTFLGSRHHVMSCNARLCVSAVDCRREIQRQPKWQ